MRKEKILIFFFLLLSIAGCHVDSIKPVIQSSQPVSILPPATQEGKNTLGFMLNGQVWTPYLKYSESPSVAGQYFRGTINIIANRMVNLDARGVSSTHQSFAINFYTPIRSIGTYKLNNWAQSGATFMNQITKCVYQTDSISGSNGTFTLTKLDTLNRVMSGTFNITFIKNGCDTERITDGRFDFKYFW